MTCRGVCRRGDGRTSGCTTCRGMCRCGGRALRCGSRRGRRCNHQRPNRRWLDDRRLWRHHRCAHRWTTLRTPSNQFWEWQNRSGDRAGAHGIYPVCCGFIFNRPGVRGLSRNSRCIEQSLGNNRESWTRSRDNITNGGSSDQLRSRLQRTRPDNIRISGSSGRRSRQRESYCWGDRYAQKET
jgi:hypothetical protein